MSPTPAPAPNYMSTPPARGADWRPHGVDMHNAASQALLKVRTLTPEAYGATGDGVTDDQTALQRMLDDLKEGERVLLAPAVAYRHSNVLRWPVMETQVQQYGPMIASNSTQASVQITTVAAGTKWRGFWNEVDWGTTAPVRGGSDTLTAPLAMWDTERLDIDGITSKLSRQCGVYLSTVKRSKFNNIDIYRSQADSWHMTHNCEDLEINNVNVSYAGDDGVATVSYLTRGSGGAAVAPCRRIRVRGITTKYGHARGASIVGGEDVTYTNLDITWTRAGSTYLGNESGYNTHSAVRCVMRNGIARYPGFAITPSGGSTPDAGLDHGHLFMLAQQANTPNVDSGYEDWIVLGGGEPVYNFTRAISNNGATYTGCFYRRIRAQNGKEYRAAGIAAPGGNTTGVTYTDMLDDRVAVGAASSSSSSLRYREATRTAGNVSVTGATLAAFDTGMDLQVPAAAGDLLEATLNIQAGDNVAATIDWNVAVVDATGATIRQLGGQGTQATIGAWSTRGGDFWGMSGDVSTTVQAGDLVSGVVRLRLQVRCSGTRTVFANGTVPAKWWVKNLGTPTA